MSGNNFPYQNLINFLVFKFSCYSFEWKKPIILSLDAIIKKKYKFSQVIMNVQKFVWLWKNPESDQIKFSGKIKAWFIRRLLNGRKEVTFDLKSSRYIRSRWTFFTLFFFRFDAGKSLMKAHEKNSCMFRCVGERFFLFWIIFSSTEKKRAHT